MMEEYWCVICGDCDTPIALLKVDLKRKISRPEGFQATCLNCGSKSAYDASELQIRKLEGIHAFKAADGFRNVSDPSME
jgi:RNase P subunit RPR2